MRSFLFLVAFGLAACGNEMEMTTTATACSAVDPLIQFEWVENLKNSITNCSCEISVIRGTYLGETVFFTAITDPLCNSISTPTLYDCDGNKVKIFTDSPQDQEELKNNVKYGSVLYRCEK